MTTFVRPKRTTLDGKGCVWEFLLAGRGFNELPDGKKIGRVVEAFTDGTVDVHFDALDYTAKAVFPDELILIDRKPGLECPDCPAELGDSHPTEVLYSDPLQKRVHCAMCGYSGLRVFVTPNV
jgi:hypothetical protein